MRLRLALPLLAVLVAGCAATPPAGYGPAAFRLAVEAPASTSAARGLVASGQAGELKVHFGHLLAPAQRRLLATLADVDKVTIQITGTGVDETATVLKAALTSGTASHTFTNLSPGALTVTIKALDAAGTTIGIDIQQATVTAGNTATVSSTLRLAPDAGTPQTLDRTPLNPPDGGGTGGGTTTGSLQTDVTIVEPTVATATYLGAYVPPVPGQFFHRSRIEIDADDRVWTLWRDAGHGAGQTKVAAIGATGAIAEYAAPTSDVYNYFARVPGPAQGMFATNREGWSGRLVGFDALGQIASNDAGTTMVEHLSFTAAGRAYSMLRNMHMGGVYTQTTGSSSTIIQPIELGSSMDDVDALPDGDVVLTFPARRTEGGVTYMDRMVRRMRLDQTAVWSTIVRSEALASLSAYEVAEQQRTFIESYIHDADQTWIASVDGKTVSRLDPNGVRLADLHLVHPVTRFYRDEAGRTWGYPGEDGIVTRFAADGSAAAYHYLGADVEATSMAVSGTGNLWVLEGAKKDLLHFTVDVP